MKTGKLYKLIRVPVAGRPALVLISLWLLAVTSLGATDSPARMATFFLTPTVSGPDTVCTGTGGHTYTTEAGMVNYSWTVSSGGTITSGNGGNSITVAWTQPGVSTVSVSYTGATGPGLLDVTVLPQTVPAITVTPDNNPVCSGAPVTLTASLVNGGAQPVLQWKVNNVTVGTNNPVFSFFPANGDVVTCTLVPDALCSNPVQITSAPVSLTVLPVLPPSVIITASANPVCQGTAVTYTALAQNGGTSPAYQWKVNGISTGTNNPSLLLTPANGDHIVCELTSSLSCPSQNPVQSNSITMTVSPVQVVGVTAFPSSNPSCQGNSVTFSAAPVNGGTNPQYQWRVNSAVVATGNTFTLVPASGDTVVCRLLSNASCATGNPAFSAPVIMTVTPVVPVSVSVQPSLNPACQGVPVTVTASPVNGGVIPSYQWLLNGFQVGQNTPQYSFMPSNGDAVWCRMTPSVACPSVPTALSNTVTMSVTPYIPASVFINASANPVCTGSPVTLTATPFNGGPAPVFEWNVNGTPAGTNSTVLTFVPSDGDQVTCSMVSSAGCTSSTPIVSNMLVMTVSPPLPVSVQISASDTMVCQNVPVTLIATISNGGPTPLYQWRVNGSNAGTSSPVYSYNPSDGDVVTCTLTSNAGCVSGNPAVSNPVALTVIPSMGVPVSVTIAPSANPACNGQPVTFTASAVNGGGAPVYAWTVNGLDVGLNSPTYTFLPSTGDFIRCWVTSDLTCATNNPAGSNEIVMTVNPIVPVSVSIVSSQNPTCQGNSVIYTATGVNPGSTPVYQWKVDGQVVGSNQNTLTYMPSPGNVVTCKLTSSLGCTTGNPANSNAIAMVVNQSQPVTVTVGTLTNPSCTGVQVTYRAEITNGGTSPQYQWRLNGNVTGSNSPVLIITPVSGDAISCKLTSNALCYTGNKIVTSQVLTQTVSTEIIPVVTIASSANPFCEGSAVTFTATPTNGGTLPVYQWRVNCLPVGANSTSYTYVPAEDDFVTCQMTSNLTCAIWNPAISNGITLRRNTGTPASLSITASANPSCAGTPVTFTAIPVNGGSMPAYQWKVNGNNAGSGGPVFTYTPQNGDLVSCRLTSNETCVSGNPALSNTIAMTTSASLPASIAISTPTNPFCPGMPVVFSSSISNGGTAPGFQWKVNGMPSGSNAPGFTCYPANGDLVTCELVSNATCFSGSNPVVSNSVMLQAASPIPATIAIAPSANPVCQGTRVTCTASFSGGGNDPVFLWTLNGVPSGNDTSVFSYYPSQGDVIQCSMTSSLACATVATVSSNAVTMSVDPVLPVTATITASLNPCCLGSPVTFNATVVNGGTAPVYQWVVNCVNAGTNSPEFTYIPTNGDVVLCRVLSDASCASGNPAVSNNINMVVLPVQNVSATITASFNPFCVGNPITFVAEPTNGGTSPSYEWQVNHVNSGSNNPVFTYNPADGDTVQCILTSNAQCTTGNPAYSNPIAMEGIAALVDSVWITASSNPICFTTLVTFNAYSLNGGNSPQYQWKVNGVNTGSNGAVYQYQPAIGDVVTCHMITSLSCAQPNPAISNTINMTVYPQAPVTVVITATPNPSCEGSPVTFNAVVNNGGTSPLYRWRKNGGSTGTNSPTFTYVPNNGDAVYCRVTSNVNCAAGNPSNSNTIVMIVSPTTPASVAIAPSANPVCAGTTVTFTATPSNGGTAPVYQWKVNGNPVGTNSATYAYKPVNSDVVTCSMTSNSTCTSILNAESNAVTMTVSPIMPVTITVTPSVNPVCINTPVTFTAIGNNGGAAPQYQWKVNGLVVGSNSPLYTFVPDNGDVVTCKLTSGLSCTSGNPATSSPVTMTVSASLPVGVTCLASGNPSCQGVPVNFTANPVNGGVSPVYHWLVNGISVGTNSPAFSYAPAQGDYVTCQMTSDFSCATGNPALASPILMGVNPNLPTAVWIVSSSNPVCAGTQVSYTASPVNGGISPVFQWFVNGVAGGVNTPYFTCTPSDGDTITCRMTSSIACPAGNPVMSNPIVMTVVTPAPASVSVTPSNNPTCQGSSVTFETTVVNGGQNPAYQWKVNGVTAGTGMPSFTYLPANGDIVLCELVSNAPCVIQPSVQSVPVVMSVSTELPVSVTVTASANPVCIGLPVVYSATGVNGGTDPDYQWKVNGINIGNNEPVLTFTPSDGDSITCELHSDFSCATGNPAVSEPVVMTVGSGAPAEISVAAMTNPVCAGSEVTLVATTTNAGETPSFQWMVNGLNAGPNLPVFSYTPQNGDVVTCQLMASTACYFGIPVLSNPVLLVVSSELPVSITITGPAGPVCNGTAVTFTAAGENGGSTPFYQWQVNGANAGINQPVLTYVPSDGDLVGCILTSGLSCATGNPDTSNVIVAAVTQPAPVSVTLGVTPSGAVCSGDSVHFVALPANGGTYPSFQWFVNGIPAGGNQPEFSYLPADGDHVHVVLTSGLGCSTGSPASSVIHTVQLQAPVPVSVTIIADQNQVCSGTPVTFTAIPVNGGLPGYQWYRNGVAEGLDQPVFQCIPSDGDQVHVVMTSTLECITNSVATSNVLTTTVNAPLPAGIVVSADPNPVCQGSPVIFTATAINGGSAPGYQWTVNGLSAGINSPVLSYVPSDEDTVRCTLLSSLSCISGNPAVSMPVVMTVNEPSPVSVTVLSDPAGPVCAGDPVTYAASPVNGGTQPVFQWYLNGAPYGSNQSAITFVPSNGDLIAVDMVSDLECQTGSPATSPVVTAIVTYPVSVAVSIGVDQNGVCAGTAVQFTATPVNGGAASYQWYRNGLPSGLNQPTFACIPDDGDQVYVVMTSGLECTLNPVATSETITMTVLPLVPAGIGITASQNPVCQEEAVTFTATPVNGGNSPAYQWSVNGVPSGTNSASFTYIPANGDSVRCTLTSVQACVTGSPVASQPLVMTVNPLLPVSVTISSVPAGATCAGTPVTYTANPVNGGGNPAFQWFVNGNPAGTNLSSYTYTPVNGDHVKVVMISNQDCPANNPATSPEVTAVVNDPVPVSVMITVDQNNVCAGTGVVFTATPVNGGTANYQWYRNGIPSGLDQPTFMCIPDDGDQVYVVMTSGLECTLNPVAMSDTMLMNVLALVPAGIGISVSQNPVCQGEAVAFTATPVNGGNSPAYQWSVNGVPSGTNSASFTYIPANGDSVRCTLTSVQACVTGSPVASQPLVMTVNPLLPVSVTVSSVPAGATCAGTPVTYTANPVNGGGSPAYQWFVNGNPAGTSLSSYTYAPVNGDHVKVVMISNLDCPANNPATSPEVTAVVNDPVPVSVMITVDQNNVCAGTGVVFTATPVNGGTASYQWFLNGIPAGLNQPTYSMVPSDGDQVYVVMTSGLPCTINPAATSNTLVMQVTPLAPVSIAVTASQNPVCQGDPVTFTAVATNGGPAPGYQWTVNGTSVASGNPSFTYVPANGDTVRCILTSVLTCVSGNPATSDPVIMTVNVPVPVSVFIAANPTGSVCAGTLVEFSATPVNGGTSPVYQWFTNGFPVGGNTSLYSYIPSDGDQVYATLTSSLTCITGSPASSLPLTLEVEDPLAAEVTIEADTNDICEGTQVTFTATPVNGGDPSYQWYRNGLPEGQNQPVFTCVPANGDSVYVALTTSLTCVVAPTVNSNGIVMTVNSLLPASVTIEASQNPVCEGTEVTYFAVPVNGGDATFRWLKNGIPVGVNEPQFSTVPQSGDRIRAEMISGLPCVIPDTAQSNEILMSVDPLLPVSVQLLASSLVVCRGTVVTFTAVPVNGGVPAFEWFRNGVSVGNNQPFLVVIPENGETFAVKVTTSLPCVVSPTAVSETLAMAVNDPVTASLSIKAEPMQVCEGSPVTFTALPVNGGEPLLRWYRNGVQEGEGTLQFTCKPLPGDRIHAEMTSTLACAEPLVSLSDTIAPLVNTLPAPAGPVSGPDSVCTGEPGVVFTTAEVMGATSYQWELPSGVTVVSGGEQRSVTLDFDRNFVSGDLRVSGWNGCGSGTQSENFRVSAIPVPPAPVLALTNNTLVSNGTGSSQWYFEGNLIEDSTGSALSPAEPGWYWSTTAVNGCLSDTSNHIYFYGSFPGGDNSARGFWVYPVPNNGSFTMAIRLEAPETFDICMYNSMGISVFEIHDLEVESHYMRWVDLRPRLKKGLYFVIFRGKDYQVWKKVLVNDTTK